VQGVQFVNDAAPGGVGAFGKLCLLDLNAGEASRSARLVPSAVGMWPREVGQKGRVERQASLLPKRACVWPVRVVLTRAIAALSTTEAVM
jgi:hypothetical protein